MRQVVEKFLGTLIWPHDRRVGYVGEERVGRGDVASALEFITRHQDNVASLVVTAGVVDDLHLGVVAVRSEPE